MAPKKRPNPGGSPKQPRTKWPKKEGTISGKMATPSEHHPRESRRLMRVNERARQQHLQRVKAALKDLQDDFSKNTHKAKKRPMDKKHIFHQWCIKHAEALFPGIGRVAYSVPPFYINKYAVTLCEKTGFFKRAQEDDSDARGDWAQRLVGRNFRLLNNALERDGGEDTMFIIGSCLYESMFKWLEKGTPPPTTGEKKAEQDWETFKGSIPDVLCLGKKCSRYFQRPEDAKVCRHEADFIILHKSKGVIFVQVKAVGTLASIGRTHQCGSESYKTTVEKHKEKIEKELKQLKNDDKVFCEVMTVDTAVKNERCHFVLALPNFTTREEVLEYNIQNKPERKRLDEVTLLLRGDLFTDDIKKAEGDYDLENVKAWWNKLEDKPVQPDFIKDVIARYIGEFSTPREYSNKSERSLVRNLCDAIRLTGKLVKRLVISKDHEDKVDFAVKRAHVKGPPGSGRTTMLIKKAEHFLKEDTSNNIVVVVDMYRGAEGTPIGHEIFISIEEVDPTRIHHTAFDVNEKGADKKLSGLTLPRQKEHILFVIDEVLPKRYWKDAVELLASRFADSQVWCADGLVTEDQETCLPECKTVELKHILRIPTSVQCVLYHADWDAERKALYKADTDHQLEVPTNGPSPVSVRHQGHKKPHLKVTECEQCADELTDLFKKKLKLVEGDSSAAGASAAPSVTLPCSITILYNIPAEYYSEVEGKTDQVETTVDKCNAYQKYIDICPFVKHLQSRGLPIHNVRLGDMDLQKEGLWDDILVSWVDTFQGLERDVVVFLPGDGPSSTKTGHSQRRETTYELRPKSPTPPPLKVPLVPAAAPAPPPPPSPQGPATRAKAKATTSKGDQQPGTSGSTVSPESKTRGASPEEKEASSTPGRTIPVPGLAKATSVRTEADVDPLPGYRVDAVKSSGGGAQAPSDDPYAHLRMAEYYWSVKDVQRYTDWDKTNLVFAATRCTAQLILIVP